MPARPCTYDNKNDMQIKIRINIKICLWESVEIHVLFKCPISLDMYSLTHTQAIYMFTVIIASYNNYIKYQKACQIVLLYASSVTVNMTFRINPLETDNTLVCDCKYNPLLPRRHPFKMF